MIVDVEAFERAGCFDKIHCKCDFCGDDVWKAKNNIKTSRKKSEYDCCNEKKCKTILSLRKTPERSLFCNSPHLVSQLLSVHPLTGEISPDPKDISNSSVMVLPWDKGCGHGWFLMRVDHRTGKKKSGCPKCGRIKQAENLSVNIARNGKSIVDKSPHLLSQLLPYNPETGEKSPNPKDIPNSSNMMLPWDENCGHGWFLMPISDRTGYKKSGCPKCGQIKRGKSFSVNAARNGNSIADKSPHLVPQLLLVHPITGEKTPGPKDIPNSSGMMLPWDEGCGHGWFEQIVSIRTGKQKSGCPNCNESKLEKITSAILTENNINFEREKRFDDCKHRRCLPFDFYIPANGSKFVLIECHGIQHFEAVEYFGGEKGLAYIQRNDAIKKQYCIDNNIPFLEIMHDWSDEKIREELQKFLKKHKLTP